MAGAAPSAPAGADVPLGGTGAGARIAVAEPLGERFFDSRLEIGGEGAEIVVPGCPFGAGLWIERHDAVWMAQATEAARVTLDGRSLGAPRVLRRGDVLALGGARIAVTELSRAALRLEVRHLFGNATVAPATLLAPAGVDDDDIDIIAEPPVLEGAAAARTREGHSRSALQRWSRLAHEHRWWLAGAVALLAATAYVSTFEPLSLSLQPSDARVSVADTWLALRSGNQIFLRRGTHILLAERAGYAPARVAVAVRSGRATPFHLVLRKLPGRLQIDTGGVAAAVSVDGAPAGSAPGEVDVPAGRHTLALRAPSYLDFVTAVDIAGARALQTLKARLQPSWGTLVVSTQPTGARLSVDGREQGLTPATVRLDAGVHLIRLSSPGLKEWESRVVIRAGEALRPATITLGEPDAQVVIRSEPQGADVAVARTFRGRTPVSLGLPSGIEHEVVVSLPGYESWTRTVLAEPAKRLALDAHLQPIFYQVSIRGVPAGAEIRVDGTPRGRAPQELRLLAVDHRIEVLAPGFVPLIANVSPTPGFPSALQYRLTVSDRSLAFEQSAPTLATRDAYILRIVPSGTFHMGGNGEAEAEETDTGRIVRLARPFYIGLRDVTNAEFSEFRAERGPAALDAQAPVTQVSWDDAVEYCNWLSRREGLEPAYQRRGGTYALTLPVTTGYRLPTEAEWVYAAHRLPRGATGSYVVSGKISEWVNDLYDPSVGGEPETDPLGPVRGVRHVVRTWSGASPREDGEEAEPRDGGDGASELIGFRIARYAE